MTQIELFVLLQVLDFITTLTGIRMGGSELNPFVAWLMGVAEPATGLMLAKIIAFGLGGYCLWRQKLHVIRWVNYYFALLVVWNLLNIFRAVSIPA